MKRRYYLSILPLAGILFGMWYIHIAASDVIYSDYIRLVNSYLPDVWNPEKFFVPDVLTRIPVNYLSRIIKEKTSLSFTDYLNRLRIDLAESLMLENPGMTMNEVALQCGYSSQHYFSRAFKNYTGMTPIAFKNKPR